MLTRLHSKHPGRKARRAIIRVALLALVMPLVSALLGAPAHAEEHEAFIIIVNSRNPIGNASRGFLADVFLKKSTRWDDGESILPVDLPPGATARRVFSEKVLERSVAAVRSYWQQRIFSGRDLPPPELASDDAVVEYVQRHRGGVGYVSGSAHPRDVKVVAIQ
jgi:ABC-type phosphate transport system substrate-binding protein